jgi:bifunctional non-homologous end joining protein LigD
MTELLPEFRRILVRGVFDGELVALDRHGRPSFERLCRRMLQRDVSVPVALLVFDVLELDGDSTMRLPYLERREILESLTFGLAVQVCPRFDDRAALWRAVIEHRLEGVVAKRLTEVYRPGERLWVKRKNPQWPRYEAEREAAVRDRQKRGRSY